MTEGAAARPQAAPLTLLAALQSLPKTKATQNLAPISSPQNHIRLLHVAHISLNLLFVALVCAVMRCRSHFAEFALRRSRLLYVVRIWLNFLYLRLCRSHLTQFALCRSRLLYERAMEHMSERVYERANIRASDRAHERANI